MSAKKPVKASFVIDCSNCKKRHAERLNARIALDEYLFGFLQGKPEICPVCGSKDIQVTLEAPGKCIDFTFTDLELIEFGQKRFTSVLLSQAT